MQKGLVGGSKRCPGVDTGGWIDRAQGWSHLRLFRHLKDVDICGDALESQHESHYQDVPEVLAALEIQTIAPQKGLLIHSTDI